MLNTALQMAYAYLSFLPEVKNRWWYFPAGLTLVLAANLCWLIYVKTTLNHQEILINGAIWDALITVGFLLTPFLFFHVRLNQSAMVGLVVMVLGLGIIKGGNFFDRLLTKERQDSFVRRQ